MVCTASSAFLLLFWRRCGSCNRPLRWWLLVHTLTQLVQIPVRCVFVLRLRRAEASGAGIEESVVSYTASPAWRSSKTLSLFTYGWFVLGVVWVLNIGNCGLCPGMYRMTIAVILQAVARAVSALACFRILFPHSEPAAAAQPPVVEAASAELIASLPLEVFGALSGEAAAESCAVCLCDYIAHDMLRRLPCGHHFHRRCADEWLRRSKRCPLCMRAVD